MNKNFKKVLFLTASILILSAEAFAKKAPKVPPKPKMTEPHTILFHDNCPRTTAALGEEVSLKATIPGYKGIISVTYQTYPEEKHAYPVTGFYECCERIRKAMELSSGKKYVLSFNTRQDKQGTEVSLSDKTLATESVNRLIELKETDVYAFYEEYREPVEIDELIPSGPEPAKTDSAE